MKVCVFSLLAGVGLLALAGAAEGQGRKRGPAKAAPWHTSYESGREEARRTGRPLLVVFRCEP